MFTHFRTDLVLPHLGGLRSLRPLTAPAGWAAMAGKSRRKDDAGDR
jgi:hypothetical protein